MIKCDYFWNQLYHKITIIISKEKVWSYYVVTNTGRLASFQVGSLYLLLHHMLLM